MPQVDLPRTTLMALNRVQLPDKAREACCLFCEEVDLRHGHIQEHEEVHCCRDDPAQEPIECEAIRDPEPYVANVLLHTLLGLIEHDGRHLVPAHHICGYPRSKHGS